MEAAIQIIEHHKRPMKFENGQPAQDAKTFEIGIVERGTEWGQTVLIFCLQTSEGKNIVAEITARQFHALVGAYNGAEMRFAANVKKN